MGTGRAPDFPAAEAGTIRVAGSTGLDSGLKACAGQLEAAAARELQHSRPGSTG